MILEWTQECAKCFFGKADNNVPNMFGTKTQTVPNTFVMVDKTVLVNFGSVNKNCTKCVFCTGDELVPNTYLARDIKVWRMPILERKIVIRAKYLTYGTTKLNRPMNRAKYYLAQFQPDPNVFGTLIFRTEPKACQSRAK